MSDDTPNTPGLAYPNRDAVLTAVAAALGDFSHHYDLPAIVDATYRQVDTGGYMRNVSQERFWEIVGRHDRTITQARTEIWREF